MLDKAIKHGKEHRKEYYGSKRFDATCRCNGSCSYCRDNRLHSSKKSLASTEDQVDEWFGYWGYPDPADVDTLIYEQELEKRGIDPFDVKTLRELDL